MQKPLTPKQEKFCQCVASGMTQADAYRNAYDASKMKDSTIIERASRLMSEYNISTRVQELIKPAVKKVNITAERILEELAAVAFADVSQFYNDDGSVKRLDELDDDAKRGIKSYMVKRINIGKTEYIDVPIINGHDKLKALELLGKTLAMFTDKNQTELSGELKVSAAFVGILEKAMK